MSVDFSHSHRSALPDYKKGTQISSYPLPMIHFFSFQDRRCRSDKMQRIRDPGSQIEWEGFGEIYLTCKMQL